MAKLVWAPTDCSLPGSSISQILQAKRPFFFGRVPFPPPGNLSDPGIKLTSPALVGGFFTTEPTGKSQILLISSLKTY